MASTFYDADLAPSPALWLGMSAQERVRLVANFHSAVRIRMKGRTHAVLHVVVENYIAQGFGPATRALTSLIRSGHTRHKALHLMGRAILEGMERTAENPSATQSAISELLLQLTRQSPSSENSP
jgi:hypothetical protein